MNASSTYLHLFSPPSPSPFTSLFSLRTCLLPHQELEKLHCHPVYIPSQLREQFFHGFCKGVMWPLVHYNTPSAANDLGLKWDDLWSSYSKANLLVSVRLCSSLFLFSFHGVLSVTRMERESSLLGN